MNNFTPEDLILYLYKETSPEQTAAIEAALEKDWTLREKLNVLKDAKNKLNAHLETPRLNVILEILKYAREKVIEEVS
ncbi:MAG: hypothetical protein N2747_09235 [Chitinophagaceae bacterium]|nr:hypothetical protein [Chitinophagaceae bacterium]